MDKPSGSGDGSISKETVKRKRSHSPESKGKQNVPNKRENVPDEFVVRRRREFPERRRGPPPFEDEFVGFGRRRHSPFEDEFMGRGRRERSPFEDEFMRHGRRGRSPFEDELMDRRRRRRSPFEDELIDRRRRRRSPFDDEFLERHRRGRSPFDDEFLERRRRGRSPFEDEFMDRRRRRRSPFDDELLERHRGEHLPFEDEFMERRRRQHAPPEDEMLERCRRELLMIQDEIMDIRRGRPPPFDHASMDGPRHRGLMEDEFDDNRFNQEEFVELQKQVRDDIMAEEFAGNRPPMFGEESDLDMIEQRFQHSRVNKALESSTSDEQKTLFAARMVGMPIQEPAPQQLSQDMQDIADMKRQLQEGKLHQNTMDMLAKLGSTLQEENVQGADTVTMEEEPAVPGMDPQPGSSNQESGRDNEDSVSKKSWTCEICHMSFSEDLTYNLHQQSIGHSLAVSKLEDKDGKDAGNSRNSSGQASTIPGLPQQCMECKSSITGDPILHKCAQQQMQTGVTPAAMGGMPTPNMAMLPPNMGPRGLPPPMGPRGMLPPMGPRGMQPPIGPRGMGPPMGPRGMRPPMGRRGMGPRGMPLPMGPRGVPPPFLGPRGMPRPNMGPRGMPRPNMGPRGIPPPNMGPRGMQPPYMGPRGMPTPYMGPRGPYMGPRGMVPPYMGPGGMPAPYMGGMLGQRGPDPPAAQPTKFLDFVAHKIGPSVRQGTRLHHQQVEKHFKDYGKILNIKDIDGYTQIEFASPDMAMAAFNSGIINNNKSEILIGVRNQFRLECEKPVIRKRMKAYTKEEAQCLYVVGVTQYTKETLKQYFSQYGNVMRIDKPDNKDFAVVHFSSPLELNKAFDHGIEHTSVSRYHFIMNGFVIVRRLIDKNEHQIDNLIKPIKKTIQPVTKNTQVNLFLRGVKNCTEDELREYFSKFGTVAHIRILNRRNKQQNSGFVCFSSVQEADAAYNGGVDGGTEGQTDHQIGDSTVSTKYMVAEKEDDDESEKNAKPSPCLFIYDMEGLTEEELQEYFQRYGPVENTTMSSNQKFAFVLFSSIDGVRAAYEGGNFFSDNLKQRLHVIRGISVKVTWDNKEKDKSETESNKEPVSPETAKKEKMKCTLFVHGPLNTIRPSELLTYFRQYGVVKKVEKPLNKDYAFIHFDSPHEVDAAYNHGTPYERSYRQHCIGQVFVIVKNQYHEPKKGGKDLQDSTNKQHRQIPSKSWNQEKPQSSLYVQGAALKTTTPTQLEEYFGRFGLVKNVIKHPMADHAIIHYSSPFHAARGFNQGSFIDNSTRQHFCAIGSLIVKLTTPGVELNKNVMEALNKQVEHTLSTRVNQEKPPHSKIPSLFDLAPSENRHQEQYERPKVESINMRSVPKSQDDEQPKVESINMRSNPKSQHDVIYTFFVKDVGGLTEEDLWQYFGSFGQVAGVRLQNEDRNRKAFAFVDYSAIGNHGEAGILGRHNIKGNRVEVQRAKLVEQPKQGSTNFSSISKSEDKGGYTYFVKYVDGLTTQVLRQYFSSFGKVVDVRLQNEDRNRKPFAFVDYSPIGTHDETRILGRHNIMGTNVVVNKAKSNKEQPKPDSVNLSSISKAENDVYTYFVKDVGALTKEVLWQYFSSFGQVAGVRLQNEDRNRKAFAFVDYSTGATHDETRILGRHNIMGKNVLVDKAKTNKKTCTYFVSDVGGVTNEDLWQYFGSFGQVTGVRLPNVDEGRKPFAFVDYSAAGTHDEDAILGQHSIKGTTVSVNRSKVIKENILPQRDAFPMSPAFDGKSSKETYNERFCICNIVWQNLKEKDITDYFSRYGRIVDVHLNRKKRKKMGFIELSNMTSDRVAVITGLHKINDVELKVEIARRIPEGAEKEPPKKKIKPKEKVDSIILSNIPKKLTEDDVHEYFEKFGEIDEIKVMQTKKSGFGFVNFTTMKAATSALASGTKVDSGSIVVKIKNQAIECEREGNDDQGEEGQGSTEMEEEDTQEAYNPLFLKVFARAEYQTDVVHDYFLKFGKIRTIKRDVTKNKNLSWTTYIQFENNQAVTDVLSSGEKEGETTEDKVTSEPPDEIVMIIGDKVRRETLEQGPRIKHVIGTLEVYCYRRMMEKEEKEYRTIFMTKIPRELTEIDVKTHFEQYGDIHELMVGRTSPEPNIRFNVGFVIYIEAATLTKAMKSKGDDGIAKHEVKGQMIDCEAVSSNELSIWDEPYQKDSNLFNGAKRGQYILNRFRFICVMCDRIRFSDDIQWNKHIGTKRHQLLLSQIKKEERHMCNACQVCYKTEQELTQHELTMRHREMVTHREFLDWSDTTEDQETSKPARKRKMDENVTKSKQTQAMGPAKIRIVTNEGVSSHPFCYTCKCYTSGVSGLKDHIALKSHKKKFDMMTGNGIMEGEKSCSICKILCRNDADYQEHLQSSLHNSIDDKLNLRNVTKVYRCQWCNLDFGTDLKKFEVHNRKNRKKHKRLIEESQSGFVIPDDDDGLQSSASEIISDGNKDTEQLVEQFEYNIPNILAANPNYRGEVKGTVAVSPGFNCKRCEEFCAWDKVLDGTMSSFRRAHLESRAHKRKGGTDNLQETVPGVFCNFCQKFLAFEESEFADVIASHCMSLMHHLYMKLHKLRSNHRLPKWMLRPPFIQGPVQTSKGASTAIKKTVFKLPSLFDVAVDSSKINATQRKQQNAPTIGRHIGSLKVDSVGGYGQADHVNTGHDTASVGWQYQQGMSGGGGHDQASLGGGPQYQQGMSGGGGHDQASQYHGYPGYDPSFTQNYAQGPGEYGYQY